MSQEHMKHKRRWLRQKLGAVASKTLWLAPALLSPVIMTAAVPDAALGQQASQTSTDSSVKVDADFVLSWIEHAAANSANVDQAAKALAEALRARGILSGPEGKNKDARIEKRLLEVEKILKANGLQRNKVVDAYGKLGPISPAPKSKPANGVRTAASLPQLPGVVSPASANGPAAGGNKAVPAVGHVSSPVTGVSMPMLPPVKGPIAPPSVQQTSSDAAQVSAASGQVELAASQPAQDLPGNVESGEELYREGLKLLSSGERNQALETFQRAWKYEGEMDLATRAELKSKLALMQANTASRTRGAEQINAMPVDAATQEQRATRQRMMVEVTNELAAAEANRTLEPQVVAERLQTLRTRVSQANLESRSQKQMLTLVDREITKHQIYMTQNRAAIDQDMRNRQVEESRALDAEQRTKIDQQIASLVETYNDLMDEHRFPEAEVVAKQVGALDRDSEIASLLLANARNRRRIGEYEEIKIAKEDGFIDALNDVDRAAIPSADVDHIMFPNAKNWEELTRRRSQLLARERSGLSPADAQIYERLKTPVLVDFKDRPLSEVVSVLSNYTSIPMVVDEAGLQLEGFAGPNEVFITLQLQSPIQARSALNLILGNKNLTYQVRDEVLWITSVQSDRKANYEKVYKVKDLVTPIPNFVHDYHSGMAGALRHAYETVAAGRGLLAQAGQGGAGARAPGNAVQLASATLDPNAPAMGQLAGGNLPQGLAGMGALSGLGGPPAMGSAPPMSMGSPGAIGGGAAMADFDTLMNLIQQTIDPEDWLAAGGQSVITPYPSNLSLVVSAPQTTHEKITELLESLRELQDLQVTIEVKFITLNDTFFERMGVDFDMRIDDNVRSLPPEDQGPSTVVGLSTGVSATNPFPVTTDFDIALSQDGFGSAVPPFGAFDASAGASLGFAILSDLEMFFFMNAAQGDQRTNILQAPRVTMFDGSFASINDTISRPFVTSLIPVVGDFAVAQQPVIVVLNEGTVLNVQATVSADKRFVRLTLNPSFSQIDDVQTFTFEGSRTTRSGTNVLDPDGGVTGDTDNEEEIISGTTVQQPSFANTSISTVVSVPDGGTILLGGIKRMREGRVERGVPILSKIPYVNRLFKNTSIGRETSTLMMTVTPRIIIQEEEEENLGVAP